MSLKTVRKARGESLLQTGPKTSSFISTPHDGDKSGVRGLDTRHVRVNVNVGSGNAPAKTRAFESTVGTKYPMTSVPPASEVPHDGGIEGKKKTSTQRKRGR